MNKKIRRLVIITILILVLSVCYFYYSIAIGFGESIPKVVRGVNNAKKEWKKDSINPLDSIKKIISKEVKNINSKDTVSVNK